MVAWKVLPLLAVLVAACPAEATVTFDVARTSFQVRAGAGALDTIRTSNDQLLNLGTDTQTTASSDLTEERFLAQVKTSAAGAISFDRPDSADFFLRTQVVTDALASQPATHGLASASAYYRFSIDTESTLSFTLFSALANTSAATNLTLGLFGLDAFGRTETTYRDGFVSGTVNAVYTLQPGDYSLMIAAFSEDSTPENAPVATGASRSAGANLSLTISSPPPPTSPVPEPATWATMLVGFGAIGAVRRRTRRIAQKVA
ncbi:PEPxxWA-CTERM sorting domain-containing protein [Sphingomonas sp. AP4-R1]|uniref:PEPxxWA-CTERM sorting domain-containing protein n=1 Tax=Sphingomonas sp. AP4-R1 TaxID=2735134 RepID=UPI001493C29B|nr:PEPxxWA-CTERM sorting domain-containing protein [Sphingomonas sp. AP4-R1]QJU58581.1 PEPxxWA-CTERM sorting domain-containing protein [Sphingomonas sp. AP4-R1]